jgi:hypothetical protein
MEILLYRKVRRDASQMDIFFQATERQRIGNQIKAAMIFAGRIS